MKVSIDSLSYIDFTRNLDDLVYYRLKGESLKDRTGAC